MKRLLLLLFILTACGAAPEATQPTFMPIAAIPTPLASCEPAAFVKQIEPLAREWEDAVTLANNTQRIALSGQISTLQAIQRRTEALDAPDCVVVVKQSLINQMNITNRAFLGFLSQQDSTVTDDLFALASEQQTIFATGMQLLKAGKPIPESPAPFTDGLKVSRDALVKAHSDMELIFPQNMGPGQTQMTAHSRDDRISATFIGTADNIRSTAIAGQAKDKDKIQAAAIVQMLRAHIQTVMPDWKDGDTWLTGVLDKPGPQTIVNRGRIVHYERSFDRNPVWGIDYRTENLYSSSDC